jgi:hypothetical protein
MNRGIGAPGRRMMICGRCLSSAARFQRNEASRRVASRASRLDRLRLDAGRTLPEQLIMAIGNYIDRHNENPRPFIWTATASDVLAKVSRAPRALSLLFEESESKPKDAHRSGIRVSLESCQRGPLELTSLSLIDRIFAFSFPPLEHMTVLSGQAPSHHSRPRSLVHCGARCPVRPIVHHDHESRYSRFRITRRHHR